MEIFLDGGLFELLVAVGFGYAINFIFMKKYLLIIFSCIVIGAPVSLIFFNSGEIRFWIIGACCINAMLLVILLWKHRLENTNKQLFNLNKAKNIYRKRTKLKKIDLTSHLS